MSTLIPTAGTKLYIGAALASDGSDFDATDFASQTWVEIGATTNLGGAGDKATMITSNQIGTGRTRKAVGTFDAGQMAVVCDLDLTDTGQIAAIAAFPTRSSYAFKVAFNDAPSGGTPSIRYFTAFVSSINETYNQANNQMELNLSLELDSNIVKVAAAEGS
jgi:hypothetical protein